MSENDLKAFRLYGKVPGKNMLSKIRKERKYFDSGDYMMAKAGVPPVQSLGTSIPTHEGIPPAALPSHDHMSSSPTGQPIAFPPPPLSIVGGSCQDGLNRRASLSAVGVGMQARAEPSFVSGPHHPQGSDRPSQITLQDANWDVLPSSYPMKHTSSAPAKTSAGDR
ncbi:hypothetical protein VHUM_03780 [Vanrija humicola]|uniref:mRNA stability protein n=1 Tax=Vanrija humicola TaxID=5417 RepID=A0A7D8UZK5_VANHU|nr:hypothetical protein VHUM_03780 [Vanrija humicola]